MNLLDMMNELGSRVRYGVGPTEKYQMMMDQTVPGQPKPFLPSGDENPEAVRYLSNYLGAKQWGQGPTSLFNTVRYLIDDNTPAYAAGVKGAQQAAQPEQLKAMLLALGNRK